VRRLARPGLAAVRSQAEPGNKENKEIVFMTWFWDHWSLVIFLALGFAAVWVLLPQARQRPLGAGIGAGIIALLGFAGTLIQASGAEWIGVDVLFYFFAGLAIVAAVCMITHRNPVYSALWFAVVILSTCGLFLLQSAPFLAAATIIVYAGAIIVTFLFVIMLAQQTGQANYDRTSREPLLATLAGFILLGALLTVLQKTYSAPSATMQIAERLKRAERLIDAKATDQQIEDAMYLSDSKAVASKSVTEALEECIDHVPQTIWPSNKKSGVLAQVRSALKKWVDAKNARDLAQMKVAVTTLEQITEEVVRDYDLHPSTLPIPDPVRPYLANAKAPVRGHYVAGLGRSLFGEYLYAVELAGTLLLIATIGAIAIASRRKEIAP
jgi:NADH-quinone oxidoreductase subunit J